jgi:hypothetical protein
VSPTTVVLVGCVKTKREGVHPARELYTSPLWRSRRRYAEAQSSSWYILSALHGLLDPDVPVACYEQAMTDLSEAERHQWGQRVVAALEDQLGTLSGRAIEIHAGGAYRRAIEPLLRMRGAIVAAPLPRPKASVLKSPGTPATPRLREDARLPLMKSTPH